MSTSRALVSSFLLGVSASCLGDGMGSGVFLDHGACDLLIECASQLAPASRDEFISTYGPGGTCWQGGPSQWFACHDACRQSLEALNFAAMLTGETCGTCQTDADCADFGVSAYCDAGLCLGVGGQGDGETGDGGDGEPTVQFDAVSILLVVDNSGSMGGSQRTLAVQAQELLAPLDAAGIPWRLGVTTTDNGNPWCPEGSTTPERGKLVLESCRTHLNDFLFNNGQVDTQDEACRDICSLESVSTLPSTTATDSNAVSRPWIESIGSQTNLPNGVTVDAALKCVVPQGINGCGFESQLYSAQLTVALADNEAEDEYGFAEPGRLMVVVFVTDETDCSYNPEWGEIFAQDGNRTFWSDPSDSFPTSAVCWNAGMQCTGDPSDYSDCQPVDLDVNGNPTDDPAAAVLRPVDGIIAGLGNPGAVRVFGIVGVDESGEPQYGDVYWDPAYQNSFGIGPGCTAPPPVGSVEPVEAVPPGRIWTVLEQLGPDSDRRAWSICSEDFDGGLAEIGNAIAAEF